MQILIKDTIDMCKQAIGHGLVIEVMPTLELVKRDVKARNNTRGILCSIHCSLNTAQEVPQYDQQHQPEQPCLTETDDATKQVIGKTNNRNVFYDTAYQRANNVQNQHRTKEEHYIGNKWS